MEINKINSIKECKECEDYDVNGYSIVIGDKKINVCSDCFQELFGEMEGYVTHSKSDFSKVLNDIDEKDEDEIEEDDEE